MEHKKAKMIFCSLLGIVIVWIVGFTIFNVVGLTATPETPKPAVVQLSDEEIDKLVGTLESSDQESALAAARKLEARGGERGFEILTTAAADHHNWLVCYCAIQVLRETKPEDISVNIALTAALENENTEVRKLAVVTLGEIKDILVVDSLGNKILLKDKDKSVRCAAAKALEAIGSRNAVSYLIEALKDEDILVCSAAASALKSLTKRDFGKDHDKWEEWLVKSPIKNK